MSDDLEKRLRDAWKLKFSDEALGLFTEAADRITHLEAKNEAMETILNFCTEGTDWVYGQVPDELARLRSEAENFHMAYRMKCDEETKTQAVEIARLRSENEALRKYARQCDIDAAEAAIKKGSAK